MSSNDGVANERCFTAVMTITNDAASVVGVRNTNEYCNANDDSDVCVSVDDDNG